MRPLARILRRRLEQLRGAIANHLWGLGQRGHHHSRRTRTRRLHVRLLCDEPTGALDSTTAKDTLILLEKINATFGTTILMVTHNQVIPQMMRQNIVMRDGRVIENSINKRRIPAEALEDL